MQLHRLAEQIQLAKYDNFTISWMKKLIGLAVWFMCSASFNTFLKQAYAWFLEIDIVHDVCMCAYLPPRL